MTRRKTAIEIPAAGSVKRLAGLPVAWVGRSNDPDAELRDQGWRFVGVDEHGRKLYAPPSRYSIWGRFE